MTRPIAHRALIVLADDDTHSAHLLLRAFAECGMNRVKWHGDSARSQRLLAEAFAGPVANRPDMVIVNLKATSQANAEFIAALKKTAHGASLVTIAIAPTRARETRDQLLAAGAAAVFETHAESAAYKNETRAIMDFLDQHLATADAWAPAPDQSTNNANVPVHPLAREVDLATGMQAPVNQACAIGDGLDADDGDASKDCSGPETYPEIAAGLEANSWRSAASTHAGIVFD